MIDNEQTAGLEKSVLRRFSAKASQDCSADSAAPKTGANRCHVGLPAGFGGDFHLFPCLDEQRYADFKPRFERGWLGDTAARRIAAALEEVTLACGARRCLARGPRSAGSDHLVGERLGVELRQRERHDGASGARVNQAGTGSLFFAM